MCLGLFLTDAAISLLDATLVLGLGLHLLTEFRGMAAFLTLGASAAIYVLMAITPMVARLVIMTLNAGNNRAELFASPSSVMCSGESSMNIVLTAVRSLGANH